MCRVSENGMYKNPFFVFSKCFFLFWHYFTYDYNYSNVYVDTARIYLFFVEYLIEKTYQLRFAFHISLI